MLARMFHSDTHKKNIYVCFKVSRHIRECAQHFSQKFNLQIIAIDPKELHFILIKFLDFYIKSNTFMPRTNPEIIQDCNRFILFKVHR